MRFKVCALAAAALIAAAAPALASEDPEDNVPEWDQPFVWDSAFIYRLITDRFYSGTRNGDHAFSRPAADVFGTRAGTFHGGDLAGITARLDYLASLGVSALLLSFPGEQVHGFYPGGMMQNYARYGYDGRAVLDYTSLDPAAGTNAEMERLVQSAHRLGMRVMISVQLVTPGPPTLHDMCELHFGRTLLGWEECIPWQPGIDGSFAEMPLDRSADLAWSSWWGAEWLRDFEYGKPCDDPQKCLNGSGFRSDGQENVSVPHFLKSKWQKQSRSYAVGAASEYRSGSHRVADFLSGWTAAWVREFGLDGVLLENSEALPRELKEQLSQRCREALAQWRAEKLERGADPAARWKSPFLLAGDALDGLDKRKKRIEMANEQVLDAALSSYPVLEDGDEKCHVRVPLTDDLPSSGKLRRITALSQPPGRLCRGDPERAALGLLLSRGPVMCFYGDETGRKDDRMGADDPYAAALSDMVFPNDAEQAGIWASRRRDLSGEVSNDPVTALWQRAGRFRLRNQAVGSGKPFMLPDGSECRVYQDVITLRNNRVLLHYGKASEVSTKGCFDDGVLVHEALSGRNYMANDGKVTPMPQNFYLFEEYRFPKARDPNGEDDF